MTYGLVPSLIQHVKLPMTERIRESGLLDTFFINFAQIRSGAEKGGDKGYSLNTRPGPVVESPGPSCMFFDKKQMRRKSVLICQ